MTCPDAGPRLYELLDGDLSAEDARALEAHVRACPACAARFEELRALDAALSRDVRPVVPTGFAERIAVEVQRRARLVPAPSPFRVLLLPGAVLGVVAAAALLLAAADALAPFPGPTEELLVTVRSLAVSASAVLDPLVATPTGGLLGLAAALVAVQVTVSYLLLAARRRAA